ncbi:hypothetical protein RI129_006278 [Pyrocoelia pectoralis]|uniref:Uncharacterized protein n=1 Tax=Pyrocoelia pectoralis TaxID=417401 RepID=A0AAN7ZNH9_9COLE
MVSVLPKISEFWNQGFWLPENVTWDNISPDSNPEILNYKHLFFAIPLTFLMLGLRYFLQCFCFAPLGTSFGIKNYKRKSPRPNLFLEGSYSVHKKLTREEILGLAKQLDWSERNVERWLRTRRNQNKTSTLDKFCESAWRVCYYLCYFIIGVMVLWNKRWLWDINECWYGYPHHHIDKDVCWYLIIALSFYGSLCVSQFSDVKRKDFWQMFSHHAATVIAMSLSWVNNLLRIASLTLFVHEFTDIFLDLAKLIKYLGYQKLCDTVFVIFTVVWMVTRLGIYPFWIIRSAIWDSAEIIPVQPLYYFFNGFLIFIFALDIFWTYFLLKIIYKFWKVGHAEGDARSGSSDNNDEPKLE